MLKKAFTLIELLVVIAIIAILAAILFPVFAQAKEAAKDTANLNNLKQQGLAVLQYCTDFDDNFPLSGQYTTTTVGYTPTPLTLNSSFMPGTMLYTSWMIDVQPYVKNNALFISPKLTPPADTSALRRFYFSQHYGAEATPPTWSPNVANWSWQNATYTGNLVCNFDGIMGAGTPGGVGFFAGFVAGANSLTQTQVETISEDVMISDATFYDMGGPSYLSPAQAIGLGYANGNYFNAPDGLFTNNKLWFGPSAFKRAQNNLNGIYPTSATAATAAPPRALTTYCATDGSAHSVDYRGRILERQQGGSGTWYFKRLSSYVR